MKLIEFPKPEPTSEPTPWEYLRRVADDLESGELKDYEFDTVVVVAQSDDYDMVDVNRDMSCFELVGRIERVMLGYKGNL